MDVQQCEYIKPPNLYTLSGWIVLCELHLNKAVFKSIYHRYILHAYSLVMYLNELNKIFFHTLDVFGGM